MNKAVTNLKPESEVATDPLALLRAPFPPNAISKLPKETKAQADQRKADQDKGNWPVICRVCNGRHHPMAVHLDYIGHAAITDRLLDVDPNWSWEPVALRDGLPAFDSVGGLWIKLTVCGATRLGYGNAEGKKGGDAVKEIIGDALRNAAMRFGAGLELWHKGVLHADEPEEPVATAEEMAVNLLRGCGSKELFADAWNKNKDGWRKVMEPDAYGRVVAEMKRLAALFPKDAEPEHASPPAPDRPPQGAVSRAASPHAPAEDLGITDDDIPEQFR